MGNRAVCMPRASLIPPPFNCALAGRYLSFKNLFFSPRGSLRLRENVFYLLFICVVPCGVLLTVRPFSSSATLATLSRRARLAAPSAPSLPRDFDLTLEEFLLCHPFFFWIFRESDSDLVVCLVKSLLRQVNRIKQASVPFLCPHLPFFFPSLPCRFHYIIFFSLFLGYFSAA